MKDQQQIQRKAEIITDLQLAFRELHRTIEPVSDPVYRQRSGATWSPAEHLEHLILSTVPIVGALGKDRDWFGQFGPPAHGEKTYAELKAYYRTVLATGLKAPLRFVPEETKVFDKDQQLADWQRLEKGLIRKLELWTEEELDTCTLPHPALGNLTMRQMLQFTTIHTYHHMHGMERSIQ